MGISRAAVAAIVLAFGAPASAQSLNVAFGHASGSDAPSSSYAAAGVAGTWNGVTGVAGPSFALVAIDGSPTHVTVTQGPTTTVLATSDPSVSGDDAALLDFGLVTSGAETCLMFHDMAPGDYEVLIYAWLPDQPTVKSRTRQDEAPSTIDVGGAWTGSHAEGVTYARYTVSVGSDGMLPAHSGLAPGQPSAALNGVQIRPVTAGGGDAGAGQGGGDDAGAGGGGAPPVHHGGCRASGGDAGALVALALALVVTRSRRRARA